jgi:lipopolysaccharide/colanic/teichoic acid biosynthesis glycosyltransferase
MSVAHRPGKRALDLVAALVALSLFSPVLAAAALAIKLEDGDAVLFRQERVGRGGRPFTVLKLRTMRAGVVTRTGRWLRGTGIDEVMQFVNVLRGEMSVVGPRPLTAADLERLGWTDDAVRQQLRPGITGPAQVFGGRGARVSRALDRRYAAEAGLLVDIELIGISFVMNLLGKERVRRALRGHRWADTTRERDWSR